MNPWLATLFFLVGTGVLALTLALFVGTVLMLLEKLWRRIGNPGTLYPDEGLRPRGRGPGEGLYDNPGGFG